MYNPPMAATVVPVVPLVSVAPSAQRKPRLLWANVYCLLDTSSGASMAVRQMLLQLQHNGWQVDVLGATVFDHERGTAGLHGHWDTLKARQGQVVKVQDAGLQHRLLVTANTPRGLMTNREEGAWFSLYEQALEQERPDVVFYYGGQPFDFHRTGNRSRLRHLPLEGLERDTIRSADHGCHGASPCHLGGNLDRRC